MEDRNQRAGSDEVCVIEPAVTYGGQTSFARTAITAVTSPMTKTTSPRTNGPIGKDTAATPGEAGCEMASRIAIVPYTAMSNPTIMIPRPNHRAGLRSSVEWAGFILWPPRSTWTALGTSNTLGEATQTRSATRTASASSRRSGGADTGEGQGHEAGVAAGSRRARGSQAGRGTGSRRRLRRRSARSSRSSTRSERGGRPRSDSSDEGGRALLMFARVAALRANFKKGPRVR